MSDSITLQEGQYDKLGIVHCGVIRGFKVHCGPEPLVVLDNNEEHLFERTGIKAKREDDEVTFSVTS